MQLAPYRKVFPNQAGRILPFLWDLALSFCQNRFIFPAPSSFPPLTSGYRPGLGKRSPFAGGRTQIQLMQALSPLQTMRQSMPEEILKFPESGVDLVVRTRYSKGVEMVYVQVSGRAGKSAPPGPKRKGEKRWLTTKPKRKSF